MPRHSKNNTALSFFTYAEGKSLDYGTKKQRLGRDSMRECDACYLCLQRARDPVCCTQGHLYCKECILENILAQKKEILRQQKLLEAKAKDEEEEAKRKAELAKEAVIQEFERQQVRITPIATSTNSIEKGEIKAGINSATNESLLANENGVIVGKRGGTDTPPKSKAIEWTEPSSKSKKRKFQIDDEELAAIAKREQDEALKKLEEERVLASKPKLPNFWLPSLTPSADPDKVKQVKQQAMCTAADPEHPISMKTLIPTKFAEDKDPTSKKINLICPSCRKTLTNSLKICLMKPCGHVICRICVDKFVRKTKQCFVCDTKCRDKDIADMSGEGTGFASGGGKVMAEKFDVAFQ